MTLSGVAIPDQSGPVSDGKKKCTPHSLKPKYSWSFSVRLFSVIIRTLIGGDLPLF